MRNWMRENLVLVSGIVLPVVLVLAFFLLQETPRFLTDPPEHDFLVVAYRYDVQHPRDYHLSFEVRENRLQGRATPNEQDNPYRSRQQAVIYRYESTTHRFTEIDWESPEDLDDLDEAVTFFVKETDHLALDKTSRSPDGYTFEYGTYNGRGGLLGELFGMRRGPASEFVLEREGEYFPLPNPGPGPYYYGRNVHFLGWIVGEEVS